MLPLLASNHLSPRAELMYDDCTANVVGIVKYKVSRVIRCPSRLALCASQLQALCDFESDLLLQCKL